MSNVKAKFLNPMMRQFNLPKGATDEPKEWAMDYQRILGTFGDEILERAADLMMATREKSTFPLPSECNRACLDAMEMLAGERNRASKAREGAARAQERVNIADWERRSARSDELFAACSFARASVDDGWSWTLWTWLHDHGRCPDQHEALQICAIGRQRTKEILDHLIGEKETVDINKISSLNRTWLLWWNNATDRISALIARK